MLVIPVCGEDGEDAGEAGGEEEEQHQVVQRQQQPQQIHPVPQLFLNTVLIAVLRRPPVIKYRPLTFMDFKLKTNF